MAETVRQLNHEFFKEMMETAKPKLIRVGWSNFLKENDKSVVALGTLFNRLTAFQAIEILKDNINRFAEQAEISQADAESSIIIETSSTGSCMEYYRMETTEEMTERIKSEAKRKADDTHRYRANKAYQRLQKEKKIEKLEKELEELRKK